MTPGPGIRRTELPMGFSCCSINSGVRKYRPDFGAIISETKSSISAVYTKNSAKAAPIHYCQSILPSDEMYAIITNSGQANAATGTQGVADNLKMATSFAKLLGRDYQQVAVASTGVIGVSLDLAKIIPSMEEMLTRQTNRAEPFACAILTTDLVPKSVATEITLSQGSVKITGICKGSGMIHPNMGTMLGYILTDAKIDSSESLPILRRVVNKTFNMISVDGDTSTNDTVFLMANGASKIPVLTNEDKTIFEKAIFEISVILAKSIAQDGEGATKLIESKVIGLNDTQTSARLAKSIIQSSLVKTAIHGRDPNWGRILARIGQEEIDPTLIAGADIKLQTVTVFKSGAPAPFNKEELAQLLKDDEIYIDINFHQGPSIATAWGCDLSEKYVQINAEYTT